MKQTAQILLSRQKGFTMIEILISMIIMAFGLLGVAAMQTMGMRLNHSAYLRTQATNLANDYPDILRINLAQEKLNKFGNSTADSGNDFNSQTMELSGTEIEQISSCYTATGCSSAQMAENDLYEWAMRVRSALPNGMVTTSRNGNIYTVNIIWMDDRNDEDSGSGVDINDDGDVTDDVDTDGDGNNDGKEYQFKQFSTSFQL